MSAMEARMTKLEQLQKAVEAAQANVEEKQRALAGVQERLAKEQAGLEDVDRKVAALPLDGLDMKVLLKLDGERTTRKVMADLLEASHLPRARQAVEQAQAALAQAEKARDAERVEGLLARFHGEAARALEIGAAAAEALKGLLTEHEATAAELAGHGFDAGGDSPWTKVARLLRSRAYADAFAEIGRLLFAAEEAARRPDPGAVVQAKRDRERRDELAIAAFEANHGAEAQASAERRRAHAADPVPQVPQPARPTGEPAWRDRR
jgi:hypothetical protein